MRALSTALALATACSFDGSGKQPEPGIPDLTRRELSFESPQNGGVDNVPVLLALDSTRIEYESVADPKRNLVFIDPDAGRELPFDIERWDPAGQSFIWVRVPRVDGGSSGDRISMQYGPGITSGGPDPTAVWADHVGVWHLNGPLLNAASASHDAMAVGTVLEPDGQIAGARRFSDQEPSQVFFADGAALLNGWDTFTIEWWMYCDYADGAALAGSEPRVFEKFGPLTGGRLFPSTANTIKSQTDVHFQSGQTVFANVTIAPRAWSYLAYSYDGSQFRRYLNGEPAGVDLRPGDRLESSPNEFQLGQDMGRSFAGMMDELRISMTGRSDAYFDVQYASMTDQLVTYGDPESL